MRKNVKLSIVALKKIPFALEVFMNFFPITTIPKCSIKCVMVQWYYTYVNVKMFFLVAFTFCIRISICMT